VNESPDVGVSSRWLVTNATGALAGSLAAVAVSRATMIEGLLIGLPTGACIVALALASSRTRSALDDEATTTGDVERRREPDVDVVYERRTETTWWAEPPGEPSPATSHHRGAAPTSPKVASGPIDVTRFLPATAGPTRPAQCPACGRFEVDLDRCEWRIALRCRTCHHGWSWAPGEAWPAAVIDPRPLTPVRSPDHHPGDVSDVGDLH
jgi:hypothetical protein